MCGTISSIPVYPERFILPNGEKALVQELKTLPKNSIRRKEVKTVLKNSQVVKTTQQNSIVLPGNGVSIHLDTGVKKEKFFCVLDGTEHIREHVLPSKTKIILSSSELGKKLIGKKIGENGTVIENGKTLNFTVKNIIEPSKVKWIFHYIPTI